LPASGKSIYDPHPEFQNIAMLYAPAWNGFVEGCCLGEHGGSRTALDPETAAFCLFTLLGRTQQNTATIAVQQTAAIRAATEAWGSCVRTWSIRSQPVHMELSTVVSEIGEH